MTLIKLPLSTCISGLLYLSSVSAPVLMSHAVWAEGPSYTPPQVGAPSRRVGGGTRGLEKPAPFLAAMVPETIAYTLDPQPTLYWALSEAVERPIEVMLVETNPTSVEAMQPLLEKKIDIQHAGIQKLALAEHGVTLKPGVEYEWFVSLMGEQRSQDVITSGVLKHVETSVEIATKQPPQSIANCMSQMDQAAEYQKFFACGVWYDGLASLSNAIESGKEDLKAVRRELMEAVALPKVATLDK